MLGQRHGDSDLQGKMELHIRSAAEQLDITVDRARSCQSLNPRHPVRVCDKARRLADVFPP